MNRATKKIVFFTLGVFFLCSLFVIVLVVQARKSGTSSLDMVNNPVSTRRYLIEQAYPEFRDFEEQTSASVQSVESTIIDSDYYFAYLVHGSEIPIAQATCFRVDRSGRVFKIGLFPDPVDSYAGYSRVNPATCKGIK